MEFFQKIFIVVIVVTIIFLIKKLMITKNLEKIEVDDELKEKLNKLINQKIRRIKNEYKFLCEKQEKIFRL